jgi:predicted dehydrogenase
MSAARQPLPDRRSPTGPPLRVAVLGAGGWARQVHLPALRALRDEIPVEIAGIWNRTTATAEAAAREFDVGRVYRELQEAVEDVSVDAFVVLVHSTAAAAVVTQVLPRGLPILSEKPPGRTYQEACQLAGQVQVPNVVTFNRRYMPLNRRFRELVARVPDAYFAECHLHRSERLQDQFVVETGVHGINFMEDLFGPMRLVRTERGGPAPAGTPLWISAVTFESGLRAILKFMPRSGCSVERYEVHGRSTSLYLQCPQSYTSDHPGTILVHQGGKLASTIVDDEGAGPLQTLGLLGAYRDFFRAARDGSATASNFRNASNTMRIAEAIQASEGGAS